MSKLVELSQKLCPEGVAFFRLDEICNIQNGYTPSKNTPDFWEDGDIPWFRMGDIRLTGRILNDAIQHITIKGVRGKVFPANSLIFATTATVGEHALITVPFVCNQQLTHIHIKDNFLDKINIKYLAHYAFEIDRLCKANTKGGSTLPAVDLNKFKGFKIPVPPLPVQEEIARILDGFTETTAKLISELTTELTMRKKQYEYYRTQLLDLGDIQRKKLREIVDVCMCKRIKKEQTSAKGEIPFYKNGTLGKEANAFISKELFDEYSTRYLFPNKGNVMLSTAGTVGRAIKYDGMPAYFQDSNVIWLKNNGNSVLDEYLYWFCMSMPWKLPTRGTIKHLHNDMILQTEISIPPIDKQKHIVKSLERFELLFDEITLGLSKEIDFRQKQYEYYRDKLLTFKELS